MSTKKEIEKLRDWCYANEKRIQALEDDMWFYDINKYAVMGNWKIRTFNLKTVMGKILSHLGLKMKKIPATGISLELEEMSEYEKCCCGTCGQDRKNYTDTQDRGDYNI